MPNKLGSPGSANMTWVWNSSPCSLMMVCPTSTGVMRPSAVSEGGSFRPGHLGVKALPWALRCRWSGFRL